MVRATNETDLTGRICGIIQELGGYRMAWIGYAEDDEAKTVRPVASAGFEVGFLERANVTWADQERGRGPTGTAIRTGTVQICTNFLTDPKLRLWRDQAVARGYQSSIALPLRSPDRTLGALTIYSAAPESFDPPEVDLLTQLADDIALGIVALRAQLERDRARQEAEHHARQLRALASALSMAEQRERERLARVLHDHLQQLLVAAKFRLAMVTSGRTAPARQQAVQAVSDVLDEALKASRSLTTELNPPALHEQGLAAGLRWLARQMHEKHGLEVEVQGDAEVEPTASGVRLLLFDAVRELLFNAVKHSGVKFARVEVRRADPDLIRITVSDEGAGFDPQRLADPAHDSAGFGLFSVRERLSHLGGQLEVQSAPGQGSRFTMTAPARLDTPSLRK
jgi:signal transduction histidine kinase